MNVTDAADHGSRRQLLVATRNRLAEAMDTTEGGREQVALSRQIEAVTAEIKELDRQRRQFEKER
jgi:hypothetical protein